MKPAKVLIICGSDSDIEIMSEAAEVFEKFSVKYDLTVSSAHRSPDRTMKLVKEAESKGYDLIIAGAGFSAHLAGVTAAHTSLPVLGVPIDSSPLKGIESRCLRGCRWAAWGSENQAPRTPPISRSGSSG